ncbi:MAG: ATP-binding protein [Bacteroidota bacterium]
MNGNAQTVVPDKTVSVEPYATYFVDTAGLLTADSLRQPGVQARFKAQPRLLSDQFATWVRIKVPPHVMPGNYCLSVDDEETITFYIVRPDAILMEQNGRYLLPSLRSLPENFRYVCFNLGPADSILYLRIEPFFHYTRPIDIRLHQAETILTAAKANTTMSYVFSGAVLVIVLCSFILYLFLHDGSYVWFGIYTTCSYMMSNTVFLGYLFGERFPLLLLDPNVLQVYFILCPLSLLWFSKAFFRSSMTKTWRNIYYGLMLASVVCVVTIPFDPIINSDIILVYNIICVLMVAFYSAMAYVKHKFQPAGYFFIGFIVPIVVAALIVLDYTGVMDVAGINLLAGFAFLVQSFILAIGVVMRFKKVNVDLLKVTLDKMHQEHEAQIFKLKNTELRSHNEIIEKQKTQLADQARKLEELNGTKDKLLSVVAHDLRAPVVNLKSILSLLSERLITAEEFHGLSSKLKKDLEGAYEMLEDVLRWAKSQQEGLVPHPIDFDLRDLADEVVQLASSQAGEKNVKMKTSHENGSVVYADRDHVHIILRNLVSNAIKFARPDTEIKVAITENPDEIRITVADEGVGISEDAMSRIRDGLKINSTRGTFGEKGTGLGLLLCREFIQLNGGKFFVESQKDIGTTVSFTLPRAVEKI